MVMWWRTILAYWENSRPPLLAGLAAWMTKLSPCGAGIAWKRWTWALMPVVQALRASRAAGAASVSIFFLNDMITGLSVRALRSWVNQALSQIKKNLPFSQ